MVSLSIQLMTTFKPSSGMQSNLVVGVGGFISNSPRPPAELLGATNVVSAMSAICAALPAQRRALHNVRACSVSINAYPF